MQVNPLPKQVLDGMEVHAPRPGPELFARADFQWLEGQLKAALTPLFKTMPDAKQADAVVGAMIQIALAISTRSLRKQYDAITPRFQDFHGHVCALWGGLSSDRTKATAMEFRVRSLEHRAQRDAERLRVLEARAKTMETSSDD